MVSIPPQHQLLCGVHSKLHSVQRLQVDKKSVSPQASQMKLRCCGSLLLVVLLAFLLSNCASSPSLSSIEVVPHAGTATVSQVGQTVQYQAMGLYTNGSHPSHTSDITSQVTWTSSNVSVATISSSGLLKAVGPGSTTIIASMGSSGGGQVSGNSDITSTAAPGPVHTLTSLTIIPATGIQKVNDLGETAQYIAIGSFVGNPETQDMTNQVTWASSDVRIATINSAGLATAVGSCSAGSPKETTITAIGTSSIGATITATSDLTVSSCGTNNLPSLTVYEFGQGTGTVVSSPGGINCGSGAGCTGHFVLGATVTLTASPSTGTKFGGFSANCAPVVPDTSSCTTSNKESDVQSCICQVPMTDNATVGAIFNLAQ